MLPLTTEPLTAIAFAFVDGTTVKASARDVVPLSPAVDHRVSEKTVGVCPLLLKGWFAPRRTNPCGRQTAFFIRYHFFGRNNRRSPTWRGRAGDRRKGASKHSTRAEFTEAAILWAGCERSGEAIACAKSAGGSGRRQRLQGSRV
jgi:hypothetical protein